MKNLSWTAYAVLILSESHLCAQVGKLPFGSPQALLQHAELSVTSVETSITVYRDNVPIKVIGPLALERSPKNGPLEVYIRRSLVRALEEIDVRNFTLKGFPASLICKGTHNGDSRKLFFLFTKHFVLDEREGIWGVSKDVLNVDLLDAVKRSGLVPLFVPGIEWATVEIFDANGKRADYQDSRAITPGLAGEIRVLKDEGVVLYPTYWAASGKRGKAIFGFTQGFTQEFENANGNLVDGYGVVRLQTELYRRNARVWAVGVTGPYVLEESENLKDWRVSHILQPDDFAAYLPQTSGPLKFFRARLLEVILTSAAAPEVPVQPDSP